MIGQVIGNYRIVSELGKGGMGMVYRAEHTQLGKPAAIKMLLPQFSSDPTIVQRFFNEARAASAIDHPGIVEISDFGTHTDGAAFIVMALLKGESLEQRLQRGPLSAMEGASIVAQVLGALGAAHARGIVHRDLKPDNIFLTPNDLMPNGIQVKLLDFGIAKLAGDSSGGFKTQTGMMMGTPAYMSPEQCMGRADLDHRTDLYAIGCILFHVLTGRPPFTGEGGTGMMIAAHMRDPAPHPRTINPNIPDNLAAIVMRLLEKDPNARFQSAAETRQALVEAGASAPSKPPTPADQFAQTMAPQMGYTATAASYGTAPTTASGSAAQQVPLATHAPAKSKTGLVLGVAVVAAAGLGVGVWAAMRGDKTDTTAKVDSPPAGSGSAGSGSAVAEVQAAGRPVEKTAAVTTADQTPCPLGKVRGFDTHGQCCWPEQAFSTAKARCIGTPSCPAGHKAAGEDCVATVAAVQDAKPASTAPSPPPHGGGHGGATQPPPDDTKPVKGTVEAPTFKLDQKKYGPGDPVVITFAAPIASTNSNRAWITIVEASKPSSQYGDWVYIADGATGAKLTAPTEPGAYEVRLHTNYPAKSTNVRQTVATAVAEGAAKPPPKGVTAKNDQRFMLASKVAKAGDSIEITFPVAMKALDGEKFWVTIVAKGAAESAYGTYAYVTDGARTMQFEMPATAGDYEIRLHANYPTKSTNLVHKAPIRVED